MKKTQGTKGKDKPSDRLKKWLKTYFGLEDGIALFLMFVGVVCHFLPPESEKQNLYSLLFDLRTELIGAGIATLLIGNASQAAQIREEKKRLILQMGSPNHSFAIEAVRLLKLQGWLQDGSLKGINLEGANLNGAGLDESNLSGASLLRASLNEARLLEANLSWADLGSVNLTEANLWKANLSVANLWQANLSKANLYGANLSGVDLRGANLSEAYLWQANFSGANMEEANLSGAKFYNDFFKVSALFDDTTNWDNAFYTEGEHGTIFPDGFNPAYHLMHLIHGNESYEEAFDRVFPDG
ncbi:MAG: pentapeptide repeat-containing protein [Anaerolineaceae bacterium]|nr:pentapeptide repeat-containing protein [Anaerolineaceae bacterium]